MIKIKKVATRKHNKTQDYNSIMQSLIDEIYQTENEDPIGYIPSKAYDIIQLNQSLSNKAKLIKNEKAPTKNYPLEIPTDGLGIYEKIIISHLIWGGFSNYIIIGEIGSGKTATVKKIENNIRKASFPKKELNKHKPIIINFNFHKGSLYKIKDWDEFLVEFYNDLYPVLRSSMRSIFCEDKLYIDFMKYVSKHKDDMSIAKFDKLSQIVEDNRDWEKIFENNQIFDYIDEYSNKNEVRTKLLAVLIKFFSIVVESNKSSLVIIYDNVDQMYSELQYRLMFEIILLHEKSETRSLIVMRNSTFESASSGGNLSAGVIIHNGPSPQEIVTKRTEYFLNDPYYYASFQDLDEIEIKSIQERGQYLLDTSKLRKGAIKIINYVAGNNVRLGLFLAVRVFINNCIPIRKNPENNDSLIRAIYTGPSIDQNIEINDSCVVNIFIDPKGTTFFLLNLRILHYIDKFNLSPQDRTLWNLSLYLKKIGDWDIDRIKLSLEYLMNIHRPLLWVDGKEDIENVNTSDIVYITQAGSNYFTHLLQELVYIQESLTSICWPDESVPLEYNYTNFEDRINILYKLLNIIMEEDFCECKLFLNTFNDRNNLISREKDVLGNYILNQVGNSIYNIIRNKTITIPILKQLRDWQSLIIIGINRSKELGILAPSLENLNKKFSNIIHNHSNILKYS